MITRGCYLLHCNDISKSFARDISDAYAGVHREDDEPDSYQHARVR